MVQMPLFSAEKLHSLHFQIPGKESLILPTGEEVMLLKDTWVLSGRAWAAHSQEPQTATLQPLEMVFLQVLWEGITFPGILSCYIFSLAFCFGLTVGMSLGPEGLIPPEVPGTNSSPKWHIARFHQDPGAGSEA